MITSYTISRGNRTRRVTTLQAARRCILELAPTSATFDAVYSAALRWTGDSGTFNGNYILDSRL